MTERRTQPCPGTRICCPACHSPVLHAELSDGDGFFLCQRKVGRDRHPCGTHFYATASAYFCITTEVTSAERSHMRHLADQTARLAYLAERVAWQDDEPRLEEAA